MEFIAKHADTYYFIMVAGLTMIGTFNRCNAIKSLICELEIAIVPIFMQFN